MTTWTIIDRGRPDRLTVKYTSDDGRHSVVMPDMFWDQVTPLEMWLGRVNPWPKPVPANKALAAPVIGLSGTSDEPERTPPLSPKQQAEMEERRKNPIPPADPLTAHLVDPNIKPEF